MNCEHETKHEKQRLIICSHAEINKVVPASTCSTCRFNTVPKSQREIRGAGDIVSKGLAFVGITPERVSAVTRTVFGTDCGCEERQKQMNEAFPVSGQQ